jgi:FkbM family methyltransferase
MRQIYFLVSKFLGLFGLAVVKTSYLESSKRLSGIGRHKINWLIRKSSVSSSFGELEIQRIVEGTRSQLGQDVFALSQSGSESPGFFVEFGATDGVALSNTYLLESEFGWDGILCEPARGWHDALTRNRSGRIDKRCVYSRSGLMVSFLETHIPELSTIDGFGEGDGHTNFREKNSTYEVETISLLDLLKFHNAPRHIDFISVDTEGSELEILNAFDFSQYTFGFIAVEHNYTPARQKIKALLLSQGYRQVYPELSDFDDWYVLHTNQNIPG